jgi:5-methylcytosine-specific restriction endonuclease McrA
MPAKLPKAFVKKLKAIKAKRAKTVINHILKHGQITTEELRTLYNYDHPPRGRRDVVEQGIDLVSIRVKSSKGRSIAAYTFADPKTARGSTHRGRRAFPSKFKKALIAKYGNKCAVCTAEFDTPQLQIDHQVPYQVGGDVAGKLSVDDFMLVCRPCNRIKSWSCEHCKNSLQLRNPTICSTCYWASPDVFEHVAMQDIRRLDVTWVADETASFDSMATLAKEASMSTAEFAKAIIKDVTRKGAPKSNK